MENLQNTTSLYHTGMHTYFENDAMCIFYDRINHILLETYIRPPSALEFRQCLEARLMAMRKFMTGRIIANISLFGKPMAEGLYSRIAEGFEKAAMIGYSFVAMAVPDDMIYHITINDIADRTEFPLIYFYKKEAAFEWIMMH